MGTNYYLEVVNLPVEDRLKKFINLEDIHICKISAGWKPVFEKTKYYSNFYELETFYKEHIDILQLMDEYGECVSWNWFEEKCKERNLIGKSHGETCSYMYNYYKDEYGFEWI